jgi:hypothetical protein
MLEIPELLGREVDPIEDICHQFERYYTGGNYFEPLNGDWIADDYFRIIDLTTKPGDLSEEETGKINRSIMRLNEKLSYTQKMLGSTTLQEAYISVAQQVNGLNAADPTRSLVIEMQPVEPAQIAQQ